MFSLILAASLFSVEKPAYFEIQVEGTTPYSVFIDGNLIKANRCYKTEPIRELVCVEVEIRYIAGTEIVSKKFFMDLEPGYKRIITIELKTCAYRVRC